MKRPSASSDPSLGSVFIDALGDMYDAEKRMIQSLPGIIDKSGSEPLKHHLREHLEQSREHVTRLERVFELLGVPPRRRFCRTMDGWLAESAGLPSETTRAAVRDTTILATEQKIEHYEIATYTTLREWAQQLGKPEVSVLLQQTLDEEIAADEMLSHLALTLNHEAARTG